MLDQRRVSLLRWSIPTNSTSNDGVRGPCYGVREAANREYAESLVGRSGTSVFDYLQPAKEPACLIIYPRLFKNVDSTRWWLRPEKTFLRGVGPEARAEVRAQGPAAAPRARDARGQASFRNTSGRPAHLPEA